MFFSGEACPSWDSHLLNEFFSLNRWALDQLFNLEAQEAMKKKIAELEGNIKKQEVGAL